jgi:exodeoxyribonuclease V beta subunit
VRHDPRAREEIAAEARQIRLETDEHAVQLVTLHKSKGLEYPIVICPHLWDGTTLRQSERELLRYHDSDSGHQLKLDLRDPADKQVELRQAEREALAEQLRLVYVALTRAKHRVSVVLGAFNSYQRSALAYLLHRSPNDTDPVELAERVRGLGDHELLQDLERFRSRVGSAVELSTLEPSLSRCWTPVHADSPELSCPVIRRALTRVWRGTSFTGLTAAWAESPSSFGGRGRDEFAPGREGSMRPDPAALAVAAAPDTLPRGPILGTAVHAVLERADFTRPEQLESLVRAELGRRPELAAVDVGALTRRLAEVLATPLTRAGTPRLGDVRPELCLKELEFLFPVSGAGAPVTPARLARVFEGWANPPVPSDYAARLAELGFPALLGYLRGFVDLVFAHQGRYYLVDYKTNYLGSQADDYAPERLSSAMVEHHYLLQYHLYVVALHRLLGLRLADYDYERHFGGVYYIFLRGVGRQYGDGHGVFFDRPCFELLRELDRELGTPAEREGAT